MPHEAAAEVEQVLRVVMLVATADEPPDEIGPVLERTRMG